MNKVVLSLIFLFALFTLFTLVVGNIKEQCELDSEGICLSEHHATEEEIVAASAAENVKVAKGSNTQGKPPEVSLVECKDRHAQCTQFFNQGECVKNPGWMIVNCPISCNSCQLLDSKVRCQRARLNISTEPTFGDNGLNEMFESIEERFSSRYGVTIVSKSPWIVTFDNFLSDAESSALISTVEGTWERSTDTGSVNEYGETGRVLSTGRTSANAWCRHSCESNKHVQNAIKKIEEVTYVPFSNYESFQILKYDPGQFYRAHHDMSPRQNNLACGPRILTFFLYLSDVEEGGETAFPQLNIAVKPKKNRALLWPSVLNENLQEQDIRTTHEARAVIKGRKYAANAWIHLYDFQIPNLWGCTGTFDNL
eukprot:gene5122-7135_t